MPQTDGIAGGGLSSFEKSALRFRNVVTASNVRNPSNKFIESGQLAEVNLRASMRSQQMCHLQK